MAVVRLGTCGCLQDSVKVGNVSVADAAALVQRNYSAVELRSAYISIIKLLLYTCISFFEQVQEMVEIMFEKGHREG